jgi:hypothetical protein
MIISLSCTPRNWKSRHVSGFFKAYILSSEYSHIWYYHLAMTQGDTSSTSKHMGGWKSCDGLA